VVTPTRWHRPTPPSPRHSHTSPGSSTTILLAQRLAGQTPGVGVVDADRAAMVAGERACALATAHRHVVGARDTVTEVQDEVARAARTIKDLQWSHERLQTGSVWPDRIIVNEQLEELARRCERSTAPIIGENLRRAMAALDAADVLTRDRGLHSSAQDDGDRQEMLTRIEAARKLIDWAMPVLDRTVERLHHTAVLARYAQEHRRDGAGPVPAMDHILRDITTDGAQLHRTVTDLSTRSADAAAYAHTLSRAGQPRPDQARHITPLSPERRARGRGMP